MTVKRRLSPFKGRTIAALLLTTGLWVATFIDRQIVGILAPFIQADLNLTNTAACLLIWPGFAPSIAVMGFPWRFLPTV